MYFRFLHLILADMHQKGIYAGGSVARLRLGSCKGDKRRRLDCKTVGLFLKISKEIGKAWCKSLMRAKRASLTRP